MPTLVVETTEGVRLPHELAGAGARAAAAVIDLSLWGTTGLFALLVVGQLMAVDPTGATGFLLGVLVGGALLLPVAYHLAFLALWDGRTPGKAFLGLRVRDAQGHPARFAQLALRSLFLPLEMLPVPIPIGLALLASSARHQRLGDVVAETLVLRDPPDSLPQEPFAGRRHAELPTHRLALTPAIAARLDARDRDLLRELFSQRPLDPDARRALFLKVGRHYAALVGVPEPLGSREAMELARELYLFLRERR